MRILHWVGMFLLFASVLLAMPAPAAGAG